MLDAALSEAVRELRWGPLDGLFVLLSAWWVKSIGLVVAAAVHDLRQRITPVTTLAVAVAYAVATAASEGLKAVVDRRRPVESDPGRFEALVELPSTASFPSGHATTVFAAATALAILAPRLRVPALALAALVAVSRVWLGVHYPSDVLAGAVLGAAVGLAVARLTRPAARRDAPEAEPRPVS